MPLNIFALTSARERRMGNLCTDDATTATLSDHLLRSILIAQKRAATVDGHQAIKVFGGRCAPSF